MKKYFVIILLILSGVVYATFRSAGVFFVRQMPPQVNTVGLIAHYKLWDGLMSIGLGKVFDYACHGHDGTIQDGADGSLVPTFPGFYFDGADDYIEIADHANFTPGGADLVTNGNFAAWVADDPTGWTEYGEVGVDPMVNEVGAGQGQGGAGNGYCNIYTSTGAVIDLSQDLTTVINQEYRIRIVINKVTDGGIEISDGRHTMWTAREIDDPGTYSWNFVATHTNPALMIARAGVASCDVTFDDISVTPVMSFSITAWINMVDATEFVIASKGVYNTDAEWRFATETNDYLYGLFFDESVANCYIGRVYQAALPQNKWLHVAMTSDGGITSASVNLYLDGTDVDDADQENAATSFVSIENGLNHAVWLNRDAATYGDGYIDDVMFWEKELSAVEVRNIYEVTKWRYSE